VDNLVLKNCNINIWIDDLFVILKKIKCNISPTYFFRCANRIKVSTKKLTISRNKKGLEFMFWGIYIVERSIALEKLES
jgi:hypothetical protein